MVNRYRELGFDALLAAASGVVLAAYMLGALLDPLPAAIVGFVAVGVGAVSLVPRRERATAAAIGVVAVGLAGVVVPRAVTSVVSPAANELAVTLVGSGLVLLLAVSLLRLTAFRGGEGPPPESPDRRVSP